MPKNVRHSSKHTHFYKNMWWSSGMRGRESSSDVTNLHRLRYTAEADSTSEHFAPAQQVQ